MSKKHKKNDEQYTEFIIDETPYITKLNKKFIEREKWVKDDPLKLYSFIPGTIKDIYVKEGDKVKADETLLILEAMKMRNRINASQKGKVKKIYVKTDDIVPRNYLLIEFE